ncbi:MAG: geranylgeranylglyceryl/heptaprenylglyceryl phosphate synthase [Cyclobacteriaceae bacterium]
MNILETLLAKRANGHKSIAILIDPDKAEDDARLHSLLRLAAENCVDFVFVGGSLITSGNISMLIGRIRKETAIPIVLFPGGYLQIDPGADGILFLSLISGRNPEFLIGQHVQAAPLLRQHKLEVLPTGYLLINSGRTTSVAYVSNTMPIPDDKYSLAATTALAGQMLGLRLIYLDAGSGAEREIGSKMIAAVREAIDIPLIVGGGINTPDKATSALKAGADLIVIGNTLEKDPDLLTEIAGRVYDWNQSLAHRQ